MATFGIDRLWKRAIVRAIPPGAERILDLACGTGLSTLAIARRFPRARIVGVELREEYLAFAREKLRDLPNVELVLSRAEDYRSAEPFDCIASSYLAKYADLPRLMAANRDMLNGGGVLLMHDFVLPPKPWLLALWRLHMRLLQTVGGALLPSWSEIWHGLPELIERTRWTGELEQVLAANRFRDLRTEFLAGYGAALVSARR